MSLRRRQVICDEACVNAQTEHRPGVAGRFKLNHDLPDHRPPSALVEAEAAELKLFLHGRREVVSLGKAPTDSMTPTTKLAHPFHKPLEGGER